jgi:hypothetical protein
MTGRNRSRIPGVWGAMTSRIAPVRLALLSVGLALGLLAVPTAQVAACSCAFTELPQAIRDAEVAFIGTLVATDKAIPALGDPMMDEITWTWAVDRSRDPISADRAVVDAFPDNGANCGVAFGIDERWLVLGHVEDGRLMTNGCMPNHRIDGSDPDTEAIIDEFVTATVGVTPREQPASESGLPLPMPVLVALAGAALLLGASAWAFRRAK